MAIAATAKDKAEDLSFQGDVGKFAKEQTERWCLACERFLDWEREHIIRGNPSAPDQQEHKTTLKWLLRMSRLMHASAADPECPDHSMAKTLEMVIWKLDESWKMIYEAMPDEEADKLLAEVFPNAP